MEVRNAINKFNKSLPENDTRRILIGLYPTTEGLVDSSIYRNEFIKNSRIPISLKRKHFFHDISAHALQGFFIPNEITSIARKRLDILQKFADRLQEENPTDAEKINNMIVSIIDEISNLASFFTDTDTKIKLGRLGRNLYENSEMVKNSADSKEEYELSQAYAPSPAYVKVGNKTKSIYRGNTSAGGVFKHSRPYLFLNSSLENSLVTLKKNAWLTLSEGTYTSFENFLAELHGDLKLESGKNLSDILIRMEQAQDRRQILMTSRMARLRNFLLRRKPGELFTPEELIIQQRIEHTEKILND